MKITKFLLSAVSFLVLLSMTSVADAHVTLNPKVSEPGSYEEYQVRVPVERDKNTVKLEIEVPEGVTLSTVEPVPGFKHEFKEDKSGKITKITWKATDKGIGIHEHMDFPIVVANPEKEGQFKWKAIQTYKDGKTVKWTSDDEKSETPAPTTEVKKSEPVKADHHDDTKSSHTSPFVWIISILALIISIVALFKRKNFTKSDNE